MGALDAGGAAVRWAVPGGADRRQCPRTDLRIPIAFREVAGRPPAVRHGQTLDVSRTGVRFRTEEFVPVRSFIAVEISLPRRGTCSARGRAVWSRQARGEDHWEVGAEFLRSGGDADAALAEALLLRA